MHVSFCQSNGQKNQSGKTETSTVASQWEVAVLFYSITGKLWTTFFQSLMLEESKIVNTWWNCEYWLRKQQDRPVLWHYILIGIDKGDNLI